jgi:hypothetical protein
MERVTYVNDGSDEIDSSEDTTDTSKMQGKDSKID